MRYFCDVWIEEWCEVNGWMDLFMERFNYYWVFFFGVVMLEFIFGKIFWVIKLEKGFCEEEKVWLIVVVVVFVLAIGFVFLFKNFMFVVLVFVFDVVIVGCLEMEEI